MTEIIEGIFLSFKCFVIVLLLQFLDIQAALQLTVIVTDFH